MPAPSRVIDWGKNGTLSDAPSWVIDVEWMAAHCAMSRPGAFNAEMLPFVILSESEESRCPTHEILRSRSE